MLQAISSILTMFSTLYGTYFSFQMHFQMSSAFCFYLEDAKILSSGNGLTHDIFFLSYFKLKVLADEKTKVFKKNEKKFFFWTDGKHCG